MRELDPSKIYDSFYQKYMDGNFDPIVIVNRTGDHFESTVPLPMVGEPSISVDFGDQP